MGLGPWKAVAWLVLAACAPNGERESGPASLAEDRDGDGWASADDCDDSDPTVSPEAVEACNGIDDDCSGEIDEGLLLSVWPDEDADGWGREGAPALRCDASGFATESGDCDDGDPAIHPGAAESCGNQIDDDCDDAIDAEDEDAVGRVVNYEDKDADGYGTGDGSPTCDDTFVPGTAQEGGDCDDSDPDVNPAARELCTSAGAVIDEDCDGLLDTEDPSVDDAFEVWPDDDGDGFGVDGRETALVCEPILGWADNDFDCDDGDGLSSPAADEVCADGLDNDCDGDLDVCGAIGDVAASDAAGRVVGADPYGLFGIAVADAGDVDGDGAHDVAVGSWLGGSSTSGSASLFVGGVTGALTTKSADLTIESPGSGDSLGWAVAGGGDFGGDGYGDLAVGAYGLGRAYLFFGPVSGSYASMDADVVMRADGASGQAGYSVAGIGDLDGDAYDDVAVGAPLAEDAGRVYFVFGSTDGDVHLDDALVRITGASGSELGSTLDGSTDIDSDGIRDLVVGAPELETTHVGAGALYLFSGTELTDELSAGDAAATVLGSTTEGALGTAVGAGDLDGDGHPDLVAGMPGFRGVWNGDAVGAVLAVRGPIGASVDQGDADVVLWGNDDGDETGASVAAGGDADRDGYEDLAVGAPNAAGTAGVVHLVLGPIPDGHDSVKALGHACVVGEDAGAATGRASAWLQDPDRDGMDDLLVGAPFHTEGKTSYAGAAYRFSGWEW